MAALALLAVSGCGFGTAGIAAAVGGGGGGGTTSVTTLSGISVDQPKTSPATIRFTLADQEADAADVALFYVLPTAADRELPMRAVQGQLTGLATSGSGIDHSVTWRFIDEDGIPRDGSLIRDVTVVARVSGGTSQAVRLALGNDAPAVDVLQVPTEIAGVAPVRFKLNDSSDDLVDVRVEYALAATPDDRRLARRAGLAPNLPTEPLAFSGVAARSGGVELVFFWDTDAPLESGGLKDLERDVVLHFTVLDPAGAQGRTVSRSFRVDNNDAPITQIGRPIGAPDDRRGIAIPYSVTDDEGDLVRVLFQWRPEGESTFPDLETTDTGTLLAQLRNPDFVRTKRICVPFVTFATGATTPVDATSVRLHSVTPRDASLFTNGRVRSLELLRPTPIQLLASSWAPRQPLSGPVAALPLGDGTTALVLDASGNTARLRVVDLATGTEPRTIEAVIDGTPNALALAHGGSRALAAASDAGGAWRLVAIDLATAATTILVSGTGGPLRGILAIGDSVAVATAGSSLLRLDWSGTPRVNSLRTGLASPSGLAHDPLRPGHVLVAETGAGRVVSVDLTTRALVAIPVTGPALREPTAIAIAATGSEPRLLAVCRAVAPAQREIVGLNLGTQAAVAFSLGTVPADAAAVAAGPAGLVLVALPTSRDLAAGGGVEQQRDLTSFVPATGIATVASAFAPPVRPRQAWRIANAYSVFDPIRGKREGTASVFVWDTRNAGLVGRTWLKATPMDTELGASSQPFGQAVENMDAATQATTGGEPHSLVATDLDADGDLDLVCANGNAGGMSILTQTAPQVYGAQAINAPGNAVAALAADIDADGHVDLVCNNVTSNRIYVFFRERAPLMLDLATGFYPGAVVVADLDRDGDLDLINGNGGSDSLTVRFQDQPRTFTDPLSLPTGADPFAIAAADLDGDGDLDLACVNRRDGNLSVYLQGTGRTFTEQSPRLPAGNDILALVAADLDADGHADLACANNASNSLTVYFRDPVAQRFSAPVTVALAAGDGPNSITAADLDGDRDLELMCTNASSNTLKVLFQTSRRAFTLGLTLATGSQPERVVAADLDGDGDLDLACANVGSASVALFYQDAPRTFVPRPALAAGREATAAVAADLDGDGDLDLACVNRASGDLSILYQEAPREFSARAPLAAGRFPQALAAADVDGDGDLDLVSGNNGSDDLTLFLQGPDRTLDVRTVTGVDGPVAVGAADMDADGDVDLVCASYDGTAGRLTVLFQVSPLSFTDSLTRPVTGRPTSVAVADVNGDGRLDVVLAVAEANNLTVFLQDAGPARGFTAQAPIAVGPGPSSVLAADLDGDRDIDLVCASEGSRDLRVFLQGATGFAMSILPVVEPPAAVTVGDLDGDGDLDLASSGATPAGANTVRVFFQDAPGTFREGRSLVSGSVPKSVVAADLDGDGDLDLATANSLSNDLSLFFGRSR